MQVAAQLLDLTAWTFGEHADRAHTDHDPAGRWTMEATSIQHLVSRDLMEDQLPRLLEQAQERGTAILPLLVEPSMFFHLPQLACFKPFNPVSRTLIQMRTAELREFLLSVAEMVEDVLQPPTEPRR